MIDTSPLRVAAYRRMWFGNGISFFGFQFTAVAVPVQMYAVTHSSAWVGLLGIAGLVPLLIFGLWGGAVADVVDRRKLLLASSALAWLSTVGLLAQALLGLHSGYLLLALTALQSAGFAVSSPARQAIIPRIVPIGLVPAANTLSYTTTTAGGVLGVRPTAGLHGIASGLRFLATQPVLMLSFAVDIVAMVFAMPRALFPEVAAERFGGGAAVGWLYSGIALGSLLAGLTSGWIGRLRRQGAALVTAVLGWGVAIGLAGLAPSLWLMVLLLAVAGAADLVSAVYRQSILQVFAPDQLRGRLQGVWFVVVAGGPRLGDLRAGGAAAFAGATGSWVGGGFVAVGLSLALAVTFPALLRYRPPVDPQPIVSKP